MKKKSLLVLLASCIGFISCTEKKNEFMVTKSFVVEENNDYMLHSGYPTESVKWEKLIASYNQVNGNQSYSNFVINFETHNTLVQKKIDSAFVILVPYGDENFGNNEMSVNLINDKFLDNFNWNFKPSLNRTIYSKANKLDAKSGRKITVDVTNLVQLQAQKMQYDLPLHFELFNPTKRENAFACFNSSKSAIKKNHPILKVYYH